MGPEIPYPLRGQTDTCENITYQQLRLWSVKNHYGLFTLVDTETETQTDRICLEPTDICISLGPGSV